MQIQSEISSNAHTHKFSLDALTFQDLTCTLKHIHTDPHTHRVN